MRGRRILCASLALASAGGGEPVVRSAGPEGEFAGVPLAALAAARGEGEPAGTLLGYRWEGRGMVSWTATEADGLLPFGPAGRTPATLLHLGLDGDAAREAASQEPRWSLGPDGGTGARVPGRFGQGLTVPAGERVVLRCARALAPPALTLELWIRREGDGPGPVLAVPGLFTLQSDEHGLLRLEAGPAHKAVLAAVPLERGRWSHVGLVVDASELLALRLVVDGEPAWTALDRPAAIAVEALELGGGAYGCTLDELRLSGRAANTSELIEAGRAAPRPLERLELATTNGPRTLEVWTRFLADPVLDEERERASGDLEHVLADGAGLRWVPGHWRRVPALDPPLARTCHPTVPVGDGRLFVFSGEVRDSHAPPMRNVADTWLFHAGEERWERLAPGLAPRGRCHQQAAYSPDHDLVLLPGGWCNGPGENVQLDDTWVFHVGERRWEERHPGGPLPRRGNERALVYHPPSQRFLLFRRELVAAYDPARDAWDTRRATVTDERGEPVEHGVPLALSGACDPASGSVLFFGGEDPRRAELFQDRTLRYEPEAGRFVVLDVGAGPSARVRPGFAHDSRRGRFVLFGGVRDQFSARMDDLWSFDPAARRWTRHEASGTPSPRGGYMLMAHDPGRDRFFLVCGRHAPERFLEEVWSLALDERAAGRARYAFDRAGFEQREWFVEGTTPGDSALRFRFRGSEDGIAWGDWSPEAPRLARFCEVEATFLPGTQGERPGLRAMGFR